MEQFAGDELELNGLESHNYEAAQEEIKNQEKDGNYLRIENLMKTYGNGF
jgi:hypothetical protein